MTYFRSVTNSKGTSKRDALLLTFTEAKLSVVEYDPTDCRLCTSSLHAYEKAISGAGLAAPPLRPLLAPYVTSDPNVSIKLPIKNYRALSNLLFRVARGTELFKGG